MRRATSIKPGKRLHCKPTLADIRRFVGKLREVDPIPEAAHRVTGKCWTFKGHMDEQGYAQFKVQGRAVWAHRFAAEIFGGFSMDGNEVDHLCLRRHCCNPAHHRAATRGENGADACARRSE